MTFKELRQASGMSRPKFAEYFGIPYRTVQSWELGDRTCPEYLLKLIKHKLDNVKGVEITRNELIKQLEELKEILAWEDVGLTDYAREKAYMNIVCAIDYIQENHDPNIDD